VQERHPVGEGRQATFRNGEITGMLARSRATDRIRAGISRCAPAAAEVNRKSHGPGSRNARFNRSALHLMGGEHRVQLPAYPRIPV
jgi:hypothetical protein